MGQFLCKFDFKHIYLMFLQNVNLQKKDITMQLFYYQRGVKVDKVWV